MQFIDDAEFQVAIDLLQRWEEKFALSKVKATTRSVTAFKQYLRIEDFSVLGSPDVSQE